MSDVTFDILIRSQADAAAVDRMRNTMRSFKGELAGVNEMLARNSNNFALSGFGDRLDITKIKASSESLGKMASTSVGVGSAIRGALGSAIGFTSAVGAIGAVAFGTARYLTSLTGSVTSFSEQIASARSRLNVTAEGFQVLTAILRENGQSPDALTAGLDRLGQVLGDAGNKAVPAVAALAKVQLTAGALKGLPRELQLELVARGLSQISDESERAAAGNDLLGRGYSQLNPLIRALATDGFQKLKDKASETNSLLSTETVNALDDLATRSERAGKRAAVAWAPFVIKLKEVTAAAGELLADMLPPPSPAGGGSLPSMAPMYQMGFGGSQSAMLPVYQMGLAKALAERKEAADKLKAATAAMVAAGDPASSQSANPPVDQSIAGVEKKAKDELEAAAAKKRDDEDTSIEIARAAARKAELQAQIESGNALYLKNEEEKRQQGLKDKLIAQAEDERKLNSALNEQANIRSDIEADFSSTVLEKRPKLIASLEEENRLIEKRIEQLTRERNLADPVRRGQIDGDISNLSGQRRANNRVINAASPDSFGDQLGSSITSFQDSVGSVPEQIGRGFSSMADSMRSSMQGAFADMVLTAQNGSQLIQGFSLAIGQAFISNMAGVVADWIMSHVIMDNIRRIFNLKRVGEEVAVQGAVTSAHVGGDTVRLASTAATSGTETGIVTAAAATQASATGIAGVFRSIMELGPIAGPVVMGASIAGMLALVMAAVGGIGKHADGTIIRGPGTQTSDSILTRLSNGEAVIPANRVAQYGPNFIQDLIDGRAISSGTASEPRESSQALAGVGASMQVSIFNHVDEATGMAWLNKRPGRKIVNRMMRDNRSETGQPT